MSAGKPCGVGGSWEGVPPRKFDYHDAASRRDVPSPLLGSQTIKLPIPTAVGIFLARLFTQPDPSDFPFVPWL
jgi:hypothetical protein